MADLETLPQDVYDLFDPDVPHYVNEDNLDRFANTLKEVIRTSLAERSSEATLRFSNLGKADRQAWMAHHPSDLDEKLSGKTLYKFLYGHVIEALLLFLAEEAGHTVEMQQHEVEIEGVKGHLDAVVDGVVVDVKSASSFGFKKFRQNEVAGPDDVFGYAQQLAGYAQVVTPNEPAAWIAMDKSNASLCVTPLSTSIIKDYPAAERIRHLKGVVQSEEMPEQCFPLVPDGTSGNMKLSTGCSYCSYKKRCFPEMRTFLYSGGPRFLAVTKKEPNVPELFDTPPEEVND